MEEFNLRRGNIDISFIIIIILLAGSSFREGLTSDPQGWILSKILIVPGIIIISAPTASMMRLTVLQYLNM